MPSNPSESAVDGPHIDGGGHVGRPWVWPLVASVLVMLWFYGFELRYGAMREKSAFTWVWWAWNPDTGYEHGPMFPLVVAGLLFHRFQSFKAAVGKPNGYGLLVVLLGVLFYVAGYRTLQARVTLGALPFLLWGSAWYLWGWPLARKLIFPLFFFLLAIPLPSFQQATTQLQALATSLAHQGASLFGVATVVQGTEISSAHGKWEPLEIAGGCSGIRSLMALLMISGAWAYIANIAMWKRVLLFFSAFPLAILGNALRVTSIFVIGEYGDAHWASHTWHDWSGLLLFYPFSLMLLLVIHSVLEGGLPWRKSNRRQLRRVVVTRTDDAAEPKSFMPES